MPNRVRFVDPGIIVQSGGGSGGGTSISSSYALSASYADYAVSASHEIVKEVSSSYADTASYAVTASYALNAGMGGGDSDWYNGGTFITSSVPVQITGSTIISGSSSTIGGYPITLTTQQGGISPQGFIYITSDSRNGATSRLMFGSTNTSFDIARLDNNTISIGGYTYEYGFRIFGIKHGFGTSSGPGPFATEIDNLVATGSMRVSGSMDITLQSGSAFTIRENDLTSPNDDRLVFGYSNGDPALRIISDGLGVATIRLQDEETSPTSGLTLNQTGQFRLGDDNGFKITNASATKFDLSPIVGSPASNTNDLGNNTRPWSNLYVYNGIGYSTGGGAGSFNSKRVNIIGENRSTGIFNYGNMSLQYSGSGASTLQNPLNHFFGIRVSSDYTPTNIRERLIFSVGKSGSLGINLNQGKTGMANPSGPNFTFYTASAMVHVEAEPNYSLNLFQGNDVNGNNVFEVDRDGNLTVDAQISASGDLYVRDGRFSRDGGAAEIEIIASEAAGGIIGTQTNDNLILRRFNIPKLTISESRNFSHNPLDVQGQVSASTYLGDGSQLTGIETDPFPYTGSAIISGSTELIGPVNITGSTIIFSSGTPGLTIQSNSDPAEETKIYDAKIALEDSGLEQVVIKSNTSTNTMTGNISLRAATLAYGFLQATNWHSNNRISWLSSGIRLGERLSDPDSSPNQTSPYVLSATGSVGFEGNTDITGSLTLSGSLLNTGTVSYDHTLSPYTLTGTEQFVLINPSGGDVTINMPDAATYPGRQIFFKLTQAAGANTVTLQRQGSDTIDGATTYTDLDVQYESISVVSNGSNGWFIF